MSSKPKLIAIVGPTASGKTDLAINIAKQVDGEVISADSRTVYRKMDIGTAKPEGVAHKAADLTQKQVEEKGIRAKDLDISIKDLFTEKAFEVEGVPHWGINVVDPDQDFTAADFKKYADEKIHDITARGKVPILAGGTGLYVSAVIDNLTFTDVKPDEQLRKELQDLSNVELIDRMRQVDPEGVDQIDTTNRRRLLRAVEIVESTNQRLSDQQRKGEPMYDVLTIGIETDREELYKRIDDRVDVMIANGLVDEVRALKEEYGCEINSMTGIGYRQICAFLTGHIKLRDAIELIKRDSRHYAKRQLTWFRRDNRIKWVKSHEEAVALVEEFQK